MIIFFNQKVNIQTFLRIYFVLCLYTGLSKEEPELGIVTEENQDEEPTKAKKRK